MTSDLRALHLPVLACNNFFPPEVKPVGEHVDEGLVRAAYQAALERAQTLGARYVVFGSPWSKACPDGFSRVRAFDQLTQWCLEIGDEAQKRSLVIALEPNNQQETNLINTFSEVAALSRAVGHPSVCCLQDYYHMRMEQDTVNSLLEYGRGNLVHAHFARIENRGFPKSMTEDPYYPVFFRALHQIGYEGGISMEGFPMNRESFPSEAAAACRFLRKAVQAASTCF